MSATPPNAPGIYMFTCIPNGKIYIGSAVNIRKRRSTHIWLLNTGRHSNTHLLRAWRRCGPDAFVFSVLEVCAIDQLREREQFYLDTLRPYIQTIGYNIAHCAEAPTRGRRFGHISEEKRQKLSLAAQNRPPISDAARENVRKAANARPPLSPETDARKRERMRAWQSNRPPISEETRERMRKAQKGHPVSDSTRVKMSASAKARPPRSETTRQKVGDAMREAHRTGRYKAVYPARHIITTPEGEELLVNMTAFCREHGLNLDSLRHSLCKGRKYKGYAIRRVEH